MSRCVCPWWLGWFLINPVRRLWQDPRSIVSPYVQPGMTVLEPGPGMGYFTLELVRRVGPQGRVVAVDVQRQMLEALRRRAERAGLSSSLDARLAGGAFLGIDDLAGAVDFVFAFAVVHELPDVASFFDQAAKALKPSGQLLLSEPQLHVPQRDFEVTVQAAKQAGLCERSRPAIRGSRSILLAHADAERARRG